MAKKKFTRTLRGTSHSTVKLEIELPVLSDEAAAAMADVLAQLYHRFEAAHYAQILGYHADQAVNINVPGAEYNGSQPESDPF